MKKGLGCTKIEQYRAVRRDSFVKWLSWIVKMSVAAVLVTMVSLYATWTAVQLVLDKVLAHYQIGQGMQKIEFSDFLAEFGKGLNIMKQPASQTKTQSVGKGGSTTPAATGSDGEQRADLGTGSGSQDGAKAPVDNSGTNGNGTEGMADALPVWSQQAQGSSGSSQERATGQQEKKTIVSTEALQSTKDKITSEDKMKLFSLLVSKLPSDELQDISQLMEDGITQSELAEMEKIIRNHLTKEEFDQLLAILEKYQ
jgi:hypothetical protein